MGNWCLQFHTWPIICSKNRIILITQHLAEEEGVSGDGLACIPTMPDTDRASLVPFGYSPDAPRHCLGHVPFPVQSGPILCEYSTCKRKGKDKREGNKT